jgi:EF-P beta-lysylation protein EpmB
MIPRSIAPWQAELARALSRPEDLLRRLELPAAAVQAASDPSFAQRVPLSYVARMRPGDPSDPLLRQVLPVAEETLDAAGYLHDPVGDLDAMAVPGVLRKYRGRALLVVTGACPVHCRYCFRRHFPYGDAHAGREDWALALDHIAGDGSVREVILSGGDPLTLSDERLADLVDRLSAIAHLQRLRIHTRMPVVLPARVDERLLGWLGATRLRTVVVIHANHPNELDEAVARALSRLAASGASLLNQSVLLRGVNDDAGVLASLNERLFEVGVLPYYLHQLDRVRGAAHFEVSDARARALVAELRARLPGYLVPRLVREEPGVPFKLPLG